MNTLRRFSLVRLVTGLCIVALMALMSSALAAPSQPETPYPDPCSGLLVNGCFEAGYLVGWEQGGEQPGGTDGRNTPARVTGPLYSGQKGQLRSLGNREQPSSRRQSRSL